MIFFTNACTPIWKQVIIDCKVFKIQRFSSITRRDSPNTPISEGSKKITSTKIEMLPQKNFLSDVVLKLLSFLFSKVLHKKSAQTYHSKEIRVLISKGLKHLNTVLHCLLRKLLKLFCSMFIWWALKKNPICSFLSKKKRVICLNSSILLFFHSIHIAINRTWISINSIKIVINVNGNLK